MTPNFKSDIDNEYNKEVHLSLPPSPLPSSHFPLPFLFSSIQHNWKDPTSKVVNIALAKEPAEFSLLSHFIFSYTSFALSAFPLERTIPWSSGEERTFWTIPHIQTVPFPFKFCRESIYFWGCEKRNVKIKGKFGCRHFCSKCEFHQK